MVMVSRNHEQEIQTLLKSSLLTAKQTVRSGSSVLVFPTEGKFPILSAAIRSLVNLIICVFAAIPVIHPNALVRVINLRVPPRHIPWFAVERWVVDPDACFNRPGILFLPDLYCLHLVALLRLIAAHRAFHKLIGMDHQLRAIPETNRIAVVEWKSVFDRRMAASIGIDPADVVNCL